MYGLRGHAMYGSGHESVLTQARSNSSASLLQGVRELGLCRAGPPGAEKRSTQESLTRRHTEGGPLRAALLQRDEGRRRGGAGAAPLLPPPSRPALCRSKRQSFDLQGLGQTRLLMPNLITAGPVTVLCVLKILGSLAGSLLELAPRVYAICRSELG